MVEQKVQKRAETVDLHFRSENNSALDSAHPCAKVLSVAGFLAFLVSFRPAPWLFLGAVYSLVYDPPYLPRVVYSLYMPPYLPFVGVPQLPCVPYPPCTAPCTRCVHHPG